MKTFWTLPSNSDFFNRYATLIPTLYRLGFLAQIVSAFTEIGIIYSLVFSGLADFWPQYAAIGAAAGAIVGTAFLEIGLRKFTPYSVQAVLYGRFSGLDLGMSIFILLATITLFGTSGLLSFKGSKSMVEAIAPEPEQQTTTKADSIYQFNQTQALSIYRLDSSEIASRYQGQVIAIKKAFASKISIERTNYANYRARERRTGESFTSAKSRIRAKIKNLEAQRDEQTAQLEKEKASELSQLTQDKKQAIALASNEYQQAKEEVSIFNTDSKADTKRKVNVYGGGLAYFTVICLFVFLLSVILHEIHYKGSGLEQRVLPTQYHFSGSILSEARNALNNRFQQYWRSWIKEFEESTPPPPIPISPNELYNIKDLEQPVYDLNYQQIPDKLRSIYIQARPALGGNLPAIQQGEEPEKALEYLAAAKHLEKAGLTDQAKEMQLKADQVISMYLGPDANETTIADLRKGCIDHLYNNAPNPFGHHHRRPIGFNPSKASVNNATVNNASTGSKLQPKDCLNCGSSYSPKVAWQKYCCTDCKEAYHAQKHGGRAFNAKAYHKTKRRK